MTPTAGYSGKPVSFIGTGLEAHLRERGILHLAVAGLTADRSDDS